MNFYLKLINGNSSFKGVVGNALTMALYTNQISPENSRQKICDEVFATVPMVIYAQKNFWLLQALNDKIELLKSAGLINFWYFQFIDNKYSEALDVKRPKVLTMAQFQGCFGILFGGIVISAVIFVIEVLKLNVDKCLKKYRK